MYTITSEDIANMNKLSVCFLSSEDRELAR